MTNNNLGGENNNILNIAFFATIALILILSIIGIVFWVQIVTPDRENAGAGFNFHSGRRERIALVSAAGEGEAAGEVTASSVEAPATDPAGVVAIFNKGACGSCHTIPNVPGAVGQIGPNLSEIGAAAANRREGYSVEAYIRESILEPGAFTAPECPTGPCPAGVMPQVSLETGEVNTIIEYLSTLGAGNQ